MTELRIEYQIAFENGTAEVVALGFDAANQPIATTHPAGAEQWTDLDNNKCRHCPLNSEQHPKCPAADNLAWIVDRFKDHKSHERITATVVTAERDYVKTTDLQSAMFSLFGLVMATSACPHMTFLRPMARFHLPFSSIDESLIRSASFYLLRQYFVAKENGTPDYTLDKFIAHYENVNIVNEALVKRISGIGQGDIHPNAIVILDSLASILSSEIDDDLACLETYFQA